MSYQPTDIKVFDNLLDDKVALQIEEDFDKLFKVTNEQHPIILKEHLAGNVSLESMVILQKLINYIPYFSLQANPIFHCDLFPVLFVAVFL